MIENIEIKGHHILKDQTWQPRIGLNIITSRNGGGKTGLLNYIQKFHKNNEILLPGITIRKISSHISRFVTMEDLADYKRLTEREFRMMSIRYPVPLRNGEDWEAFRDEYKTLFELRDADESKVQECNDFFKKLNLQIQIDNWTRNSGRIRFLNHAGKLIEFSQISTGEKTAFVLWLIMQSNPKPQVILFDEFDGSLNNDKSQTVDGCQTTFKMMYLHLLKLVDEFKIQIFVSTNRSEEFKSGTLDNSDLTTYKHLVKFWSIVDGQILPPEKFNND